MTMFKKHSEELHPALCCHKWWIGHEGILNSSAGCCGCLMFSLLMQKTGPFKQLQADVTHQCKGNVDFAVTKPEFRIVLVWCVSRPAPWQLLCSTTALTLEQSTAGCSWKTLAHKDNLSCTLDSKPVLSLSHGFKCSSIDRDDHLVISDNQCLFLDVTWLDWHRCVVHFIANLHPVKLVLVISSGTFLFSVITLMEAAACSCAACSVFLVISVWSALPVIPITVVHVSWLAAAFLWQSRHPWTWTQTSLISGSNSPCLLSRGKVNLDAAQTLDVLYFQ